MRQYNLSNYNKNYFGLEFYDISVNNFEKEEFKPFGKQLIQNLKDRTGKINLMIDFTNTKINAQNITLI